ncbi:MAG: hypothetical protein KC731_13450 [Myxococcales bacterium]|nr:hypothetical protein [Myxococcales bacterium]
MAHRRFGLERRQATRRLSRGAESVMVAAMASSDELRAFAEALFSTPDGPPPAERIAWLCEDFHDFVEQAGPRSELIFKGALFVATWLAPPTIGRRPPLANLSLADRSRALETMEQTPAGLPLLALKAILCTIYYEDPGARAEIGVDRPGGRS